MPLSKKWISIAALALLIKKAAAVTIVGLVMAISVLIIGGVIIYKLIQFFHSPAWTNPNNGGDTTNTVSEVTYYHYNYSSDTSVQGHLFPDYWMQTNGYGPPAPFSPSGGFNVTYGLDLSSNPVVNLSGSPTAMLTSINNGSDYTFSFALSVAGFSDVITFSTTNMLNVDDQSEFDYYTTNDAPATQTNAFGDTISTTGGLVSTNLVILQYSTDLINWTNILTNSVSPGILQTYTDTNYFPACFYRVAYPPQ